MNARELWQRHQEYLSGVPEVGLTLDVSRIEFDAAWLETMLAAAKPALQSMRELEAGSIANPDEKRMVGHYWLRAPQLAPSPEISREIASTVDKIEAFTTRIHDAGKFTEVLSIGIGGSALGPMFVADALGSPRTDKMRIHFVDNTDPDGIERVLAALDGKLDRTLTLVTSKSGGTPETYNGMKLVEAAYKRAGLWFPSHAVAITMPGSKLDGQAVSDGWLMTFPMFDWIGGRTSELSVVGLLPAALQGLDIRGLLAGAAACDVATRNADMVRNPAMMMALMWHKATGGRGLKDMVVLPYKDRLLLFSRYLQQLVMESLGKRLDLTGKVVEQGIAVYGNKGSTDQHAYVQQLRDGVNNFFVLFVRVLESGGDATPVEPGVNAGDYLNGLLLGTREALAGNGRESMMVTVPRVDARVVGALIALFERAVGFYASLIGINAYHQPGVEAGKKAAASVLSLQRQVVSALSAEPRTVAELAAAAEAVEREETVYLLLQHLAANGGAQIEPDGCFSKG